MSATGLNRVQGSDNPSREEEDIMKSTKPLIVMFKRHEKRTLLSSLRRLSLTAVAAMALAVVGLATDPAALAANGPSGNQGNQQWVGTWSTALHAPDAGFGITNPGFNGQTLRQDRKSTRLNSSHVRISYAVFCLKKK